MRHLHFLSLLLAAQCHLLTAQSAAAIAKIDSLRTEMWRLAEANKLAEIAEFYAEDARIDGFDVHLSGLDDIRKYWRNLSGRGVDWIWEIDAYGGNDLFVIQTGISHLTLAYGADHITYSSAFSVVWRRQDNGEYKIYSDFYRFHDQLRYRAFDVRQDSVRIIAGQDTLFGWLFKPVAPAGEKRPAILCLQGGGNAGIDNYLYEAEMFARCGITALVCDKAGAGKSKGPGSWITQTFRDKLKEYGLLIDWLSAQPFVDKHKVGVHGPSEGGRMAVETGIAYPEKVAFVNAVSAPLETLKENQLYAIEQLLIKTDYPYSVIAEALALFNDYFDAVDRREIPQSLAQSVQEMRKKYPKMYLPLEGTNLPRMPRPEDIHDTIGGGPKNLQCPVYFQYGADDKVVNVHNCLKKIPDLPHITLTVYDDTDHSINLENGSTHGSYHLDKLRWVLSVVQP